jgi:hypothetical protein
MTNTELGKPESIREWYDRTTRKTRLVIGWSSVLMVVSAVFFFFLVPHAVTLRLQVFNGAWVIPIAALIWIVAFVWIFLIPSREVGFRSQEALDKTTAMMEAAVEGHIKPALEVWRRLGDRIEAELADGLLTEFRQALKTLRETALKVQVSTESSTGDLKETTSEIKQFTQDMKPAIEALKRIQGNFELEIKDGFFDHARMAMESIRHLGGGPLPAGAPKKGPNLDAALAVVQKKASISVGLTKPVAATVPAVEPAAAPVSAFPQGPLPVGPLPVGQAPVRIEKIQV